MGHALWEKHKNIAHKNYYISIFCQKHPILDSIKIPGLPFQYEDEIVDGMWLQNHNLHARKHIRSKKQFVLCYNFVNFCRRDLIFAPKCAELLSLSITNASKYYWIFNAKNKIKIVSGVRLDPGSPFSINIFFRWNRWR